MRILFLLVLAVILYSKHINLTLLVRAPSIISISRFLIIILHIYIYTMGEVTHIIDENKI